MDDVQNIIKKAQEGNPNIGVIVGFIDHYDSSGCQAHAVDANDGETMASHFCSSEGWAISDLGFSLQGIPLGGSDNNNLERNQVYGHKYPGGYVLFWLGNAYHTDFGISMMNKRQTFNNRRDMISLLRDANHGLGLDELISEYSVHRLQRPDDDTYEERMRVGLNSESQ